MGKLEWKNEPDRTSNLSPDSSEADIFLSSQGLTFAEMSKHSPARFIILKERWCPHCKNAETSVKTLKKLSKLFELGYVQFVFNYLKSQPIHTFTVSDLISEMELQDTSDGNLQRKALAILSVLGYVRKEKIEYKNKKGETKIKLVHKLNDIPIPCFCYDKVKDVHILDWENESEETNYFWKSNSTTQKEVSK